jgi:hydrogenase maturation protease
MNMNTSPNLIAPRILVAGMGNIFLGDDAFGVEVVRRLAARPRRDGVKVIDFGIRGLDLALALVEPWDRVILVDAVAQGRPPGTLVVIEPDPDGIGTEPLTTHEMVPARVLASARALGAKLDRVWIVGCEPESLEPQPGGPEEHFGLSPTVSSMMGEAVRLVESLIAETREAAHA